MNEKLEWWQTGAWKEKEHIPPRSSTSISALNPACRHPRTSYDQANCEACIKFSELIQKGRECDTSTDV